MAARCPYPASPSRPPRGSVARGAAGGPRGAAAPGAAGGPRDGAPRGVTAASRALALACALLAAMSACAPLYLPPVPEAPPRPEHTQLDSTSSLDVVAGRPVLTLVLSRLVGPEGGSWLDVQWFGPGNAEVASASLWVTPADVGRTIELPLPDDVDAEPGEWRAVVSHLGAYVRQFQVDLAADPEPGP